MYTTTCDNPVDVPPMPAALVQHTAEIMFEISKLIILYTSIRRTISYQTILPPSALPSNHILLTHLRLLVTLPPPPGPLYGTGLGSLHTSFVYTQPSVTKINEKEQQWRGNDHHGIPPEDELTSDCEPNAHLAVRSFLHPSFGTNAHPCASENVKLLLSRFKY